VSGGVRCSFSSVKNLLGTFLKRIRQGDLVACQFQRTITDRKGTFANLRCRLRYLLFCNRYKNSYSDEKEGQPFRAGLLVSN
jgi:hypothetical protein